MALHFVILSVGVTALLNVKVWFDCVYSVGYAYFTSKSVVCGSQKINYL